MTNWQRLWRVQLIGIGALLVFCVMLSLFLLIEDLVFPSRAALGGRLLETFRGTVVYGTVPVLLLGAPVYVAVTASGRFRWGPLLVAALGPGAVLLLADRGLGAVAMLGGLFVLACMHRLAARWTRP